MAVEIVFKDGASRIVERCFLVETKGRKGKWKTRFAAQTRPGSRLRWIEPKNVEKVRVEAPVQPPPRWPRSG